MTNFSSSYYSKYTVPQKNEKKAGFVSNYSVKKTDSVISGNSRPQNLKFTSRLVSK